MREQWGGWLAVSSLRPIIIAALSHPPPEIPDHPGRAQPPLLGDSSPDCTPVNHFTAFSKPICLGAHPPRSSSTYRLKIQRPRAAHVILPILYTYNIHRARKIIRIRHRRARRFYANNNKYARRVQYDSIIP